MEKVICALWRDPAQEPDAFNGHLLASLPGKLRGAGASRIRINLRDGAVAPAAGLVQRWQAPQQDAVLQFWVPSANAIWRSAIDKAIAGHCLRHAAWLVAESTIIPNTLHPPTSGQRTAGWSQASFISFRPDLSRDAAIRHWHSHHTRVAIDTQSNFEYVQNIVACALTADAPPYDAFVEECFPAEAMTDPAAFFDAAGDPGKFEANVSAMNQSCAAFIDFSRIDIIPTSQFDLS